MRDYTIEYAHIYTDQQFSGEQVLGIRELKKIEEKLQKQGKTSSRIILIDDYSPGISFSRFNTKDFLKKLEISEASPDVVVKESSLLEYCQKTIDLIENHKVKKKVISYIETRQKFPCSLFIATWYLLRLGAFGKPQIETLVGESDDLFSEKVVSILPDSFQTPEDNAIEIIRATKFKDLIEKVEKVFFYYMRPEYSSWDEFDPYEYMERNYGKQILFEDSEIIRIAVASLKDMGIKPKSLQLVADVGVGPNLNPTLILSPYVSDKGQIQLMDFIQPNLDYIEGLIKGGNDGIKEWNKFEELVIQEGGEVYQDSLERAIRLIQVKKASIYKLPKEKYDAVSSFFTAEGISDKMQDFQSAISSLVASVKKDGIIMTAHMVGSSGYFAGERTSFPSVQITVADIENAFAGKADVHVHLIGHGKEKPARLGYHGMALVIGKKL